jgi:predicted transcriptional regulator
MEREDIVALIKAVKKQSGKMNKDLAADMGVAVTRLSTMTSQGDMLLSSFIRLLEVSGQEMLIQPSSNGVVVKVQKKNECNECAYKQIAEQVDSANVHLDENKKLVIEV